MDILQLYFFSKDSLGYADTSHKANSYRTSRAAISEAATFVEE